MVSILLSSLCSICEAQRYQPFTYEQMLAPVLLMQRMHEQYMNAFEELAVERATLKGEIDPKTEPEAYSLCCGILDDINREINNLSKNGLDQKIGKRFSDLRVRAAETKGRIKRLRGQAK